MRLRLGLRLGVAAALLGSAVSVWAATSNFTSRDGAPVAAPAALAVPLKEFQADEKLVYHVSWMGIPVGIGEVQISAKTTEGGREVYHVKAVARTNEVLAKLYPVEDIVESTFDAKDFRSLRFRKKVSEGRYRAEEETQFDSVRGKGLYQSKLNGSRKEFDAAPGVLDIVSAFYAFRTTHAKPGDIVRYKVSSEEKDWSVDIHVLRTERIEMKGGVVDTLLIEPKTSLKGVLYRRGRVWISLTADSRRVPVLIRFKTPFGPVVGVLRDFDTLPPRV